MDLFDRFYDFAQYLGFVKAFVMVAAFYILSFLYSYLPAKLEKKKDKLSKFLTKKIN